MRSQLSRTFAHVQSRSRVASAPFGPPLRHTHSGLSDDRFDKSRSFSSPSLRYQNGSSNSYQSLYTAATQSPRPSSPLGALAGASSAQCRVHGSVRLRSLVFIPSPQSLVFPPCHLSMRSKTAVPFVLLSLGGLAVAQVNVTILSTDPRGKHPYESFATPPGLTTCDSIVPPA